MRISSRLINPSQRLEMAKSNLIFLSEKLDRGFGQMIRDRSTRLMHLSQLMETLSFKSVLGRGYALIRDNQGLPVTSVAKIKQNDRISIELRDGFVHSVVEEKS